MDTLTQGLIGACGAQLGMKREDATLATICGALAGFAPDADTFIKSATDPLLSKIYHRHFTHSLLFIPVGSFIVAGIIWAIFFRKHSFKKIYLYTLFGYSTHALLDACTSYGTQLLWPLTSYRFAWDSIAIIDPLYSIPLMIGVGLSIYFNRKKWAVISFIWSLFYLGLGGVMNYAATNILFENTAKRSHQIERYRVMPTLGNLFLWRTLYESQGRYYVDAVSLWPGTDRQFYMGESVQKFDYKKAFPDLETSDTQYKDIERFRWFSQDWLGQHPELDNVIVDLRYSADMKGIKPLWGIELTPPRYDQHIKNYQMVFEERSRGSVLDYFKLDK